MERKVTREERQVFLAHPELVMFDVDTRKKTGIATIAMIFAIILPVFLIPIALIASPFGEAHPNLAVGISVVFTVFWVFQLHGCSSISIRVRCRKNRRAITSSS